MTECDLEISVPDWLIEHPEVLTVIQKLGIDCSCGGKSLEYACQELGIDPQSVLAELRRHIANHRNNT